MTLGLDSLPYDVHFGIAGYLDIEDVVHVSETCQQLRSLLDEETLCRKVIEVGFSSLVIDNVSIT